MNRWVLHIDMDAFFASVEQLTRPTLRGRPVLVGGIGGRGVVAGCSYEAREYGAHSAMPMIQARRLMPPQAVVVSPRKNIYGPVSHRVFSIIRRRVPVVEQLSVDEAFMEPAELHGATPEEVREWSEQLRAEIRAETGLPCSIGAGSGKQYAKIGSGMAKPNGVAIIDPARRHELLDPLPVGKLWGIGPVSEAKLHAIGVRTIGDFAQMSLRDVEVSLGRTNGPALWNLARGHDDRPVQERAVAKSISAEYTYPEDLTTQAQVHAAIDRAGQRAHERLLHDGRGARTVTVKVRLADLSSHTRSETLPFATIDDETLLAIAHRIAFEVSEVGPMRLVGVGLSGLDSNIQEVMFPELDRDGRARAPAPQLDFVDAGFADPEPAAVITDELTAQPVILPESKPVDSSWYTTADVHHDDYGHGWVQGAGHGVVTVRFESRSTGPGRARTFAEDDPALRECTAVCSLDWADWFAAEHDDLPDTDAPDI
ncbi:DNA polymerase IV [Corynebacterium sp. TAE3-ERU12]|uniref:DNA polymerase IV n=1 Tax=Corynebacterium sp. TAE3-ERU12 TaxID=2849491 RepID=UPI001C46F0E3|nr:DNA polymerase IV [Corynebacterium sp. TAE3-ERU12]MBV7296212.1 DNA polymerase IV [Corynebacterium sp. TAE3-ERU12]